MSNLCQRRWEQSGPKEVPGSDVTFIRRRCRGVMSAKEGPNYVDGRRRRFQWEVVSRKGVDVSSMGRQGRVTVLEAPSFHFAHGRSNLGLKTWTHSVHTVAREVWTRAICRALFLLCFMYARYPPPFLRVYLQRISMTLPPRSMQIYMK